MLSQSAASSRTMSPPPRPSTPGGSLSASISSSILNNMFKSLVIEGNMRKGEGPVKLKMYAKIAVPANPPQQSYPLFPESDIRLGKYAIHPLDSNSTPYAFPPNASPLLHRAARVLNLKPASDRYYDEALAASRGHHTSQRGPHELSPAIIGEIVVRNFHICFRSPKFTIVSASDSSQADSDSSFHQHRRRTSFGALSASSGTGGEGRSRFGEKSDCYYVIALELRVPLAGRPPSSPFMICIPTPRCLSNQIKLRMPPVPLDSLPSSSSASSDDGPSWDIMTIPNVNPSLAHSRRRNSTASIESWADDEDGWSEGGHDAEGPIIEGTFLASQEHSNLIVRWAINNNPTATTSPAQRTQRQRSKAPRKRVKLHHVNSSLTYTVGPIQTTNDVHDDGEEPVRIVLVDVDYSARCEGIMHPGVETELAVEVGLDSYGSDVYWPKPEEDKSGLPAQKRNEWTVTSDKGYRGWKWDESEAEPPEEDTVELEAGARNDVDDTDSLPPDSPSLSNPSSGKNLYRLNSMDDDAMEETVPRNRNFKRPRSLAGISTGSGSVSSLSASRHSASLLRAPLPSANTIADEFSFENPSLTAMEPPENLLFHSRRPTSSVFTSATTSSGEGGSSQGRSTLSRSTPNFATGSLARTESESTTMSGVSSVISGMGITTDWESSPQRPSFANRRAASRAILKRSEDALSEGEPTRGMLINLDLLALLGSQRVPDPDGTSFDFNMKGRIVIVLPASSGEKVNVKMPAFKFPGLEGGAEQRCILKVVPQEGMASPAFSLVDGRRNNNTKVVTIGKEWWDGQDVDTVMEVTFPGWKKPVMAALKKSLSGLVGRRQASGADPDDRSGTYQSPSKRPPLRKQDESDTTLHALGEDDLGPASDLVMPHPFAQPSLSQGQPGSHGFVGLDQRSRSITKSSDRNPAIPFEFNSHPESDSDIPTISWVKIEVIPLQIKSQGQRTQRTHDKSISKTSSKYLVHMKASWPFTAGTTGTGDPTPTPHLGMGFSAPPTASEGVTIDVQAAHFGAIAVKRRIVDSDPPTIGKEKGSKDHPWLSWIEFDLPDGCSGREAELEVLYTVERDIIGPKGRSFESVILPRIAAGVTKIEVDVNVFARERGLGINKQTNLEPDNPNTPKLLRNFSLPPLALTSLDLEVQYASKFGMWTMSRRTLSILTAVWQIWHFLVTLGLVVLMWNMSSEIRDMKGLSPYSFRNAGLASLGSVFKQPDSRQITTTTPFSSTISTVASSLSTPQVFTSAATASATVSEKPRHRAKHAETFNVPEDIWGDRSWVANLEKESVPSINHASQASPDPDDASTPVGTAFTTLDNFRQAVAQLSHQNVTLLCTSTAKTVVRRTKDLLVFIFNYTV
ncbi:hypothetical protein FRC02_005970 [Tulasnella sp. 418]|nr:hypothetical protein FRC02_005970 [Tulasnella sp. 418]